MDWYGYDMDDHSMGPAPGGPRLDLEGVGAGEMSWVDSDHIAPSPLMRPRGCSMPACLSSPTPIGYSAFMPELPPRLVAQSSFESTSSSECFPPETFSIDGIPDEVSSILMSTPAFVGMSCGADVPMAFSPATKYAYSSDSMKEMLDFSDNYDLSSRQKEMSWLSGFSSSDVPMTASHVVTPNPSAAEEYSCEYTGECSSFVDESVSIPEVSEAPSASSSSGRVFTISGLGTSCHNCKRRKSLSELVPCKRVSGKTSRSCKKRFCIQCLSKYGVCREDCESSSWHCLACQGKCGCATCSRKRMAASTGSVMMSGPSAALMSAVMEPEPVPIALPPAPVPSVSAALPPAPVAPAPVKKHKSLARSFSAMSIAGRPSLSGAGRLTRMGSVGGGPVNLGGFTFQPPVVGAVPEGFGL